MAHSNQPLGSVSIDPTLITSLTGPDNHTGIFFDADLTNSSVVVQTNDTIALYVDKYQNLGINTTSPTSQLEVNAADGNCMRLTYNSTSASSTLGITSDGKMTLATSGSEINVGSGNDFNVKSHNGSTSGLLLNDILIRSTADQLNYNTVTPGTVSASKAVVVDSNRDITNLRNLTASQLTGTLQTGAQPNITSVSALDITTHDGSTVGLSLGGVLVGATADQLGYVSVAPGTGAASKAVVLDASRNITNINNLTATNLTGTLQTASQINITNVGTLLGLDIDGSLTGLSDLSIGTTSTGRTLIVNSSVGNCLQLVYDTPSGTPTVFADMIVSAAGNLSISPSGGDLNLPTHNGSTTGLKLGGTLITASADQINYLQGTTPGSAVGGKALIVDSSRNIDTINNLTAVQLTGTLQTAAQPNINSVNVLNIANHNGTTLGLALNGTLVTATATELNYVDTTPGTATASKALVIDGSSSITGINSLSATSINGAIQTAYQPQITSVDVLDITAHDGSTVGLKLGGVLITATAAQLNSLASGSGSGTFTDIDVSGSLDLINFNGTTTGIKLGGSLITASAAEINVLDGAVAGTASASNAVVLDANKDIAGIRNLSATQLTGTLQTGAQPNITSVGTLTGLNINSTSFSLGALTLTIAKLSVIDGVSPGTAVAGKAVIVDSNRDVIDIRNLTALNLTGTLQTANQFNVTSLGTLTSLSISGNLTMGSAVISSAEIGVLDGVTAGTALASKAVVLDANKDITSIRNITASNLTLTAGLNTAFVITGTLNIGLVSITEAELGVIDTITPGTAEPSKALVLNSSRSITNGIQSLTSTFLITNTITVNTVNGNNLNGTLQTAAQPNITSIGTLSSLTISGTLTMGTTAISEAEIGVLDSVTAGTAAASKALVLDSSTNITGIGNLTATNLSGEIQTAAQPNITSVGTLSSLTISGALTIGATVISESLIGAISGMTAGTAAASKAVVLDANKDISGIRNLSADSLTSSTLTIGSTTIDETEIGVLDSVTAGTAGANKALVFDISTNIEGINSLGTTTLVLDGTPLGSVQAGYLVGVSPGTAIANKVLIVDSGKDIIGIHNLVADNLTGTIQTASQPNITSVGTLSSLAISGALTIGSTTISASEIGVLDSVTAGTADASKALVLDSSSNISGINSVGTTILAVGSPANSNLPVEIGYTSYQFSGAYAYNNNVNAHGLIEAGNGPTANYSLRADGRILVTGEVEITSDRRLKKDITPLTADQCKQFVQTTTPVRFNWRNDDAIPDYGYIAQDILKSGFDDLVTVVPHPGMEGSTDDDGFVNPADAKFVFSPGKIIPMLALNQKLIFEEQDAKDQEIAYLKDRLDALEALIAKLV